MGRFSKYFYSWKMSRAIRYSNEAKFRELVRSEKFNITDALRGGRDVVQMLLEDNNSNLLTILFDERAEVMASYPHLYECCRDAMRHKRHDMIVTQLIKVMPAEMFNLQSSILLHHAIKYQNKVMVKALLEQGADVLAQSDAASNAWQCYIASKTLTSSHKIYALDEVGIAVETALYAKMHQVIYFTKDSKNFEALIQLKGFGWIGVFNGHNIIKHLLISKNFDFLDRALDMLPQRQTHNMLCEDNALDTITYDVPLLVIKKIVGLYHDVGALLLISAINHDDLKLVELL